MLRVQRLITPEAASVSGPSLLSIASSLALGATLVLMALPLQARKADEPQSVQAVVVDFAQVKIKHQPPPPEYPQDAKDRGIQGTVVVRVTIGTDGLPKTILATSGPEELRECATTYASQWAFEPVEINGQKVMATFELTMPFRLR